MADRLEAKIQSGLIFLNLNAALTEPLQRYLSLLAKWNKPYNLTAVRQPLEMVSKHVICCCERELEAVRQGAVYIEQHRTTMAR